MRINPIRIIASIIILQIIVTSVSAQVISIAVVDLEGIGISQVEAVALSNRLRNELFRLSKFKVVDRGLMQNILEEQDLQQLGCTSNECLVELGRLLGVQQMIGGSISKIENMISVSTRIVDVETGEVLSVSDYDREAGLAEILTNGMREVALALAGEAVPDPVATKVSSPVTKSIDGTIKRFAVVFGRHEFQRMTGRLVGGEYYAFSYQAKRTYGSRLPIRPVLTIGVLQNYGKGIIALEGAYTFERRAFNTTLLLGFCDVEGEREAGPTFSIQIESKTVIPIRLEAHAYFAGVTWGLGVAF